MAPNALHKLANITDEELDSKAVQLRQRFFQEYDSKKSDDNYEPEDVCRLREDHGYCQRFVAHQRNNVDKALDMVKDVFKWRKEYGVKDIQESSFPSRLFETKGMHIYRTDTEGNPILLFNVARHYKVETSETYKRFLVYWLEELERRYKNPLIVCIFNFTGAGPSNVDIDQTMFFMHCFIRHYPFLVGYILPFNMPWIFNAVWKMAKGIVPKASRDKIIFVDKESILNYVSHDYLSAISDEEKTTE